MEKGQSEVISYVLIVAIVIISSTGAYMWAYPHMEKLGDSASSRSLINQMSSLDYTIRQVANGEVGFQNSLELYMPKGSIILNEENNVVSLTFLQELATLGYVETPYIYPHNRKHYREVNTSHEGTVILENFTYLANGTEGFNLDNTVGNEYCWVKGNITPDNSLSNYLLYNTGGNYIFTNEEMDKKVAFECHGEEGRSHNPHEAWGDHVKGVWHFEDNVTVTDSSGNDNTGTIYGDPDHVDGYIGKAFKFNGSSDDYISIPHSKSLNLTNELTISAWVNHSQNTNSPSGLTEQTNTIQLMEAEEGYFGDWGKEEDERTVTKLGETYGLELTSATGGTIVDKEEYRYHVFNTTGTFDFNITENRDIEVLVVAGGGGGAGSTGNTGRGGGGAGGIVHNSSFAVTEGTYTVIVGEGGSGGASGGESGSQGQNSSFGSLVAIGGGGGANLNEVPGDGGSGGGAGVNNLGYTGGIGLQPGSASGGYGNDGGNPGSYAIGEGGGGGGGADTTGGNGATGTGGAGGAGIEFPQFNEYGDEGWFGGGGGGSGGTTGGDGGIGGGGTGSNDANTAGSGHPNTGGGGGGSQNGAGGDGGSGIVIVRYERPLSVQTLSAIEVGRESAKIRGNLTDMSVFAEANVSFQYRIKGETEWNQTTEQTLTETQEFEKLITNLQHNQTYEFKAIAKTEEETTEGKTQKFYTADWSTIKPPQLKNNSWTTNYHQIQNLTEKNNTLTLKEKTEPTPVNLTRYCEVTGGDTSYNEYITNVQFNGINRTSGDDGGYADHTDSISDPVEPGETYELEVTASTGGYNDYISVVFDWKGDGNLTNEQVIEIGSGTNDPLTVSTEITVPKNAQPGPTLMRVMQEWEEYHTDPCSNQDYGETEDYTITVAGEKKEKGLRISEPYQTEIEKVGENKITWQSTEPTGTNITIYTAITDTETAPSEEEWDQATNNQPIPSITQGQNLTEKYLWFKQTLNSEGEETPELHEITAYINQEEPLEIYYLTINSTEGGNVIIPGEDTFEYENGTIVNLFAESEENYTFTGWTGDTEYIAEPASAETNLTMPAEDISITANFELEEVEYMKIIDKGEDAYSLKINPDNTRIYGYVGGTKITAEIENLDTYNHYALTYNNSMLSLYINGELRNSTPMTGSINTNQQDINIGGGYNGTIDETRVYDEGKNSEWIKREFKLSQSTLGGEQENEEEEMEVPTTCEENTTHLRSPVTDMVLRRTDKHNNIYHGATGAPGRAEVGLCYPNMNVTWREQCIKGKTPGRKTTILIEKEGISEEGKPIISVDFC